jgi:hypothetical protein
MSTVTVTILYLLIGNLILLAKAIKKYVYLEDMGISGVMVKVSDKVPEPLFLLLLAIYESVMWLPKLVYSVVRYTISLGGKTK